MGLAGQSWTRRVSRYRRSTPPAVEQLATSFLTALPEGVDLSDVEWCRDRIVLSGSVFVDPGGGAFNYSLPAVWVSLGPESWASLGYSEWFAQPGTTYRIVTAPDRLIVIG